MQVHVEALLRPEAIQPAIILADFGAPAGDEHPVTRIFWLEGY